MSSSQAPELTQADRFVHLLLSDPQGDGISGMFGVLFEGAVFSTLVQAKTVVQKHERQS